MSDERPWIKLHDGVMEHPKVVGLSDKSFRLLIETWCYCGRNLTDGKVPAGWWQRQNAKSRRDLEMAGLVTPDGQGTIVHDYLAHQRSAAEVQELKAKRVLAGQAGGLAKASNRLASARANALAKPKQTSSKFLPELEVEVEKERTNPPLPPARPAPVRNLGSATDAERLVRAYTDAAGQQVGGKISSSLGNDFRRLLGEGQKFDRLEKAARICGEKGWTDIDQTLLRMDAPPRKFQTNADANLALLAKLEAEGR